MFIKSNNWIFIIFLFTQIPITCKISPVPLFFFFSPVWSPIPFWKTLFKKKGDYMITSVTCLQVQTLTIQILIFLLNSILFHLFLFLAVEDEGWRRKYMCSPSNKGFCPCQESIYGGYFNVFLAAFGDKEKAGTCQVKMHIDYSHSSQVIYTCLVKLC